MLHVEEVRRPPPGRTGRSWPWTTLAVAVAIGIAALYPITALAVGPLALPAAVGAVVLLAISRQRPAVGVAAAFLMTSFSPGLFGSRSWVPGLAWIAVLFALLALRLVVTEGQGGRLPPLALPVLVYGGTVLVAYGASPAPDVGLPILRSTVTGILLFLVAASALRSWQDIKTVLVGMSGAAVVIGGFGCLQHVLGASTGIGFVTSTGALVERATAGFGHPNLFAGFLVVLVPLAVAGAVVDRRWRLVHVAALVLALGGVYASFSRGALLAVLLMPLLLMRGRWLLLFAPVAVLASAIALPSVMTERFAVGEDDGAEMAGRFDIWSTAGAIWLERPLLGSGLGSFPGKYAAVRVSGKQFLQNTQFEPPPHAHNLGLQLLAEQGLLGFTAFAAVAGATAWNAMRLRRSKDRPHAIVGGAVLAALCGMLVHNLFDVTLVENAGVLLWGVLGLLSAVVVLDRGEGAFDDG